MVTTNCIRCLICNHEYRLRIGVGYDSYQKHYFDCITCKSPIVIAVRAIPPQAYIEVVENSELIKFTMEDRHHTIMNFHPNFSFNSFELHDPKVFVSMSLMRLISSFLRLSERQVQDISTQFDVPNAPNLWGLVKRIIRFPDESYNKSQDKLLSSYIDQRKKNSTNVKIEDKYDIINDFLDSLFYPKITSLTNPIFSLVDSLHKDSKLDDFYVYYKNNILLENMERYITTFSDYFRFRDHFGQLVVFSRISSDDVDGRIVGSKNFDEIKLYYGQVYESLTSNFVILACLFNIKSGRSFDTFNSMSLNKYIKDVEKAKKHQPFKDDGDFRNFIDGVDSSLRNGSHHASIWHDGELVMYRSGGTGERKQLTYSRYIHLCNQLSISLAAIMLIEFYIQYNFEK